MKLAMCGMSRAGNKNWDFIKIAEPGSPTNADEFSRKHPKEWYGLRRCGLHGCGVGENLTFTVEGAK